MRFSYQKLKPPSFFVEKETADGIVLHYRSKRKDYKYYVRGQLKQVSHISITKIGHSGFFRFLTYYKIMIIIIKNNSKIQSATFSFLNCITS
jgi:hypothetical protein